jgi:hypothetical protein
MAINSLKNYRDFQLFLFPDLPGIFLQDSIRKMPEIPSIYLDFRKIEEIIGNLLEKRLIELPKKFPMISPIFRKSK